VVRRTVGRGLIASVCRPLLAVAVAWLALCALALVYLRYFPPPVTALQLQRWVEHGERLGSRTGFVPLASLGPYLPYATVVAEDGRFYKHHGLDWDRMRRAAADNLHRRRMWRGGSTITQQLVKNLFLTTHGSVVRKALEVPLSLLAEAILPKSRILELYLNVVEWGPGIYGAQAAAEHYYDVSAAKLNRDQAARLVACLPAPRTREPQRMDAAAAAILHHMTAIK
jgi:monofunctional biosynthetic peptidoglycan transglycosylase